MRLRALAATSGLCLTLAMTSATTSVAAVVDDEPRVVEGELENGTAYRMVVPQDWNGTLVLNADLMRSDDPVGTWLNDQGHAVASRSRDVTDWAVRAGADDMIELKGLLAEEFGEPSTTVAYGGSLGGLVTRTLVEAHTDELDAVVPMCGGGAGLVGMWNHRLDALFALQVLLAPGDDRLEMVHVSDQGQTDAALREIVTEAMTTEEGRARVALAGALGHFTGWAPRLPERPADLDEQLDAVASGLSLLQLRRSVLESTAGGNISWNVGVDYDQQFAESDGQDRARHFYAEAGLDLQADLDRLAEAQRIEADVDAVDWARSNGVYTGEIGVPVLSVFTRVDERGALSEIHPYSEVVERAGDGDLLRQVVVEVSGHCGFTAAERIAVLDAALQRVETGQWGDLATPDQLNARAAQIAAEAGQDFGVARFAETGDVPPFPRSFFADSELPGAEEPEPAAEEIRGTLEDGTPYVFVVPENWNGTVLVDLDLASGRPPTESPLWTDYLLPQGYAGAGTTRDFVTAGWDIAAAVRNQVEALGLFEEEVGEPDRVVAFGRSGGGNTAAAFTQEHPELVDGAIAMCGNLAGSVGVWNGKLDTTFALKTLLAPDSDLPIVGIPADPMPSVEAWRELVDDAQQTPEGRARLTLAAALGQLPVWGVGALAEPDPDDVEALQYSVYRGLVDEYFLPAMFSGQRQELLGGGVPRWNNGIDYRDVFGVLNAPQQELVRDVYREAGLDLDADLATINAAERIVADPEAVAARQRNNSFSGDLRVPMLTLANTGDVVSPTATASAYRDIVYAAGNGEMLRQAFVHSAGHCAFSVGEQAAVVEALTHRLDTGEWGQTGADALNVRATALAPGGEARFVDLQPDAFARPFSAADVYDPAAVCETCEDAAGDEDPTPPPSPPTTTPDPGTSPGAGGSLPATGAELTSGLIAAVGLVLSGALVSLLRLRRRTEPITVR